MHTISNTVTRKFINSIDLSNLEIETDSGWQPINAIHKTIPYDVWYIKTINGLMLECADDHIVFDENFNEIFVKNIKKNITKILTKNGPELVVSVEKKNRQENMYDVTVNHLTHRFYTNDILSHNTTAINALSYALYGQALSNIRRDNLINKTNTKNMLVSLDFEIQDRRYRIIRGRRPNVLKFYVDDREQTVTDDSQGDSRETQDAIEKLLGISHDMFKHIVTLNTYTEPFLSLRANDQRAIIEQLLGITLLSERAERIKELNRQTKDASTQEEFRIRAVIESNKKISQQIESLRRRQTVWTTQRTQQITELSRAIAALENIDIDQEISQHRLLVIYVDQQRQQTELERAIAVCQRDIKKHTVDLMRYQQEIAALDSHQCYACGQTLHNQQQHTLKTQLTANLSVVETAITELSTNLSDLQTAVLALGDLGTRPPVFYENLELALNHKNTLAGLYRDLESATNSQDPYAEQITEMELNALAPVDYALLNELTRLQEHQDFLLKLLTSKDSFVRKKIIDQNLSYLNNRLSFYLERIGLPHIVRFQNDLSVGIEELGRELDFDNLSRGERNRLILSMSWAFRDVWESLYQPVNLLFIDEMIDSGLDSQGVESSLALLKKMSRERNKSIWLVSHRDELIGRVSNVLRVIKEGGFTTYSINE